MLVAFLAIKMVMLIRQQIVIHAIKRVTIKLKIQIILPQDFQLHVLIVIQRMDGHQLRLITMQGSSRFIRANTMVNGMFALIVIQTKAAIKIFRVLPAMNTTKLIRIKNIRDCQAISTKAKHALAVTLQVQKTVLLIMMLLLSRYWEVIRLLLARIATQLVMQILPQSAIAVIMIILKARQIQTIHQSALQQLVQIAIIQLLGLHHYLIIQLQHLYC